MDFIITLLGNLLVFVLGSAIGSFLNVVVYRIPANLSILYPPSRCPHCLTKLRKQDNVPILGWLLLRGRCRHCRQPIALRYPIVEAVTGLFFVGVFLGFGISWATLGYWAFLSWLLALTLIDVDTMTLPNALTQSGLVVGLGFHVIQGWGSGVAAQLMVGITGAVAGIWLFDLITVGGGILFGQEVMGGGDAKLAAMIGAWLGWQHLLLASFLACAIGAFAGGAAMAIGWLRRGQPFPFGPFLAVGAGLALFWGDLLWRSYLGLFFPAF